MANRKRAIPQYGTVMKRGVLYYRTRIKKGYSDTEVFGGLSERNERKFHIAHRITEKQKAGKARKYTIFRTFSIPKILSGLFGFDRI